MRWRRRRSVGPRTRRPSYVGGMVECVLVPLSAESEGAEPLVVPVEEGLLEVAPGHGRAGDVDDGGEWPARRHAAAASEEEGLAVLGDERFVRTSDQVL